MYFLRGNENERKEGSKTAVKYRDTFPDIIVVECCDISNKPVISKQDTLLTPKTIIRDFKPTNSTKIDEDDLIKVKMKQLFNQMKSYPFRLLTMLVSNNTHLFVVFK